MVLFEGRSLGIALLILFGLFAGDQLFLEPVSPARAAGTTSYVDEEYFFSKVKKTMHARRLSQTQFETYLNLIRYFNTHPEITDRRWLAYVMATAWHETQLRPVREGFKKTDAAARKHVAWMYRKHLIVLPYHLPDPVTGHVYYGRGYVQLTWAVNYKKLGAAIGMGDALYRNPDLVLKPEIASKVLFVGMIKGKFRYSKRRHPRGWQKLKLFFNDRASNWSGARNIINGDLRKNGRRVGSYGKKYFKAIRLVSKPPADEETPFPPEDQEVRPDLPGTGVAGGGPSATPPAEGADSGASSGAGQPEEPDTGTGTAADTDTGAQAPGPVAGTGETGTASENDDGSEVVPHLPGTGEIATGDTAPSDETATDGTPSNPPDVAGPVEGDPEIAPIPVENPVPEETQPNGGTGETNEPQTTSPSGDTGDADSGTGLATDSQAGGNGTPDMSANGANGEAETGTDGNTSETAPSGAETGTTNVDGQTSQPAETPNRKRGWWETVKSFFAKYSKYVWKF